MTDFKKYATRHLGLNSMVLDDVIKSQNQYLNPYILEERQLNVFTPDDGPYHFSWYADR